MMFCRMSLKIHFMNSNFVFPPKYLNGDEQGEPFHLDKKQMEERYQQRLTPKC